MLVIHVKPGEQIERALKRYKQKVRKTKQVQNLRDHQYFTKKSQVRREEIAKARYKEEYDRNLER
ncbi:30S ribosomal protein S21 [Mangrovimonas futianensis]|uniref:30S ribosomal protein S21 n=1 Tax=Mangrovimonas futianensis TaxID=2895523 RepID=UPI001E5E2A6E|nr:30S ribosomal protein S21 [Mangrovimonas futianensis]MCF1422078.1 30S ribosomal protein S21 [Mangrovimonas futianensis]